MNHDLPKLVRDRIPEIIRDDGYEPFTQELDNEEVLPHVREKIVEEARELQESGDPEELVDLLEIIDRYMELEEAGEEIEEMMEEKRKEKGGFDRNFLLEDFEPKE